MLKNVDDICEDDAKRKEACLDDVPAQKKKPRVSEILAIAPTLARDERARSMA